jgi:transposase-like protein
MSNPKPETLSTFEFFRKFPDEEAARKFFEAKRWGNEPVCGHCGSVSVTECKDHNPMPYRCKDCRKHFSVRTGTVLAESRLALQKWLLAIFMLTSARKGIPSTATGADVTDNLPRATHRGILPIGWLQLDCFVLEDGRRVFHKRGMARALGRKSEGGNAFMKTLGGKKLGSEPDPELWQKIKKPIVFKQDGPDPAR